MIVLLGLVLTGWMGTAGGATIQAQASASPCADTLDTAEQAYRNRSYEEAIALASSCTDSEAVGRETAIRAYRLITLASLRQGALVQARSAVTDLLQIDPDYTPDPVNDPPAYDLFVSMVRRDTPPEATAETQADTTSIDGEAAGTPPPETEVASRARRGLFLKFGGGISDYTGDYPAQNVGHPLDFQEFITGSGVPLMASVELGYQVSSGWAVVAGFQFGNYPIVGYGGTKNSKDSDRYTPQFLIRYTFRSSSQTIRPYFDLGGNITFGGEPTVNSGYGPSLGGGLSIALGRRVSMYVESRFNLTFPDDAIDDFSSDGEGFDGSVLNPADSVNQLLGVGLRINFGE